MKCKMGKNREKNTAWYVQVRVDSDDRPPVETHDVNQQVCIDSESWMEPGGMRRFPAGLSDKRATLPCMLCGVVRWVLVNLKAGGSGSGGQVAWAINRTRVIEWLLRYSLRDCPSCKLGRA